jgi:bifunctional non-homologous end joining protein LigD
MSLREYHRKRDFRHTSEPEGNEPARSTGRRFVVQKHAARRLHYDFRLELNGVLRSWAVPKGPSLDPEVKALAVQVEDHPLAYATFEGIIPEGEYGGGTVMVWDQGEWEPEGNAARSLAKGRITFVLYGEKLAGRWSLVRLKDEDNSGDNNWLLMKRDDDAARSQSRRSVTEEHPTSVLTGRTLEQIAADADRTWSSGRRGQRTSSDPAGEARESFDASPPASLRVDPSRLSHARKAKLPQEFAPQLATSANAAPTGDQWLHELKFDGYRLLGFIDGGTIRLVTRRGNDWTDRFPSVVAALRTLGLDQCLVDGELVALDDNGISDFQRLQNSMHSSRQEQLVYYVFDAPFFAGYTLQQTALLERKELLASFLLSQCPGNDGIVRYSDHIRGQGPEVLRHSCQHALEGVVSKRIDSPYESRRSRSWLKSKCQGRQEFVIGGFTRPQGSRTGFGALLVGYRKRNQWVYCGRVGTGFTQSSLKELGRRLHKLKQASPPFGNPPTGAQARSVTWTKPQLVAEVEFSGWTDEGRLRHPSFQGLREDKAPEDVVREDPIVQKSTSMASASRGKGTEVQRSNGRQTASVVAGISLSHPDRVIYPDQGITKLQLARYYEAVSDWILPHVAGRPLTIVRCPQGQGKKCFFQKHWTESLPDAVDSVFVREKKKEEPYVVIGDLRGLISLVQMSSLELHPWGARADRLERPDMIVFDLDPGEGVAWKDVRQAAVEIRDVLLEAELESFVRTSGGKGLHVVVPITRRNSWEEVGDFSQGIALRLAQRSPTRYVANMRKDLRKGRIFIDYHRNRRGATAIASYSTRARAGAAVATPLEWDELADVTSASQWTVANVPDRLRSVGSSVWEGYHTARQSITRSARAVASRRDTSHVG